MTKEEEDHLLNIVGHTTLTEIEENGYIIIKRDDLDDLLNDQEDKRKILGAIKEDLQRWVKAIY